MIVIFVFLPNSSFAFVLSFATVWSLNLRKCQLDLFKLYLPYPPCTRKSLMELGKNMPCAFISPIHAMWPSHLYLCDWTAIEYKLRMKIKEVLIMQFTPSYLYVPNILLSTLLSSIIILYYLFRVRKQLVSPYKPLYMFICMFLF